MDDKIARKPGRVPTLSDVARHAQVSTATVSRCLNSPERVVEKTRKRVLSAIKELGYSPNFSARALAARRTNTFGAIIPTMENAIFARGLQAFQEELRQSGITLLVASSSYHPDLEEEQIHTLVARGADALLLIGHHRDPRIYDFLDRRGVPVLVAWAYDTNAAKPSIGFDNREAMARLTSEVIAEGHRNIGIISAPQEDNDRARDRVKGIVDMMERNGLDAGSAALIETPYSIENGQAAFRDLMKRNPRPTVAICGNDVLAVGALHMAHEMGIDVPGEVSITGFDDIELATVAHPPLTTVHVPHRKMGQDAARLLVDMVERQEPVQSVKLATNVQMRGTLGPAPKNLL